jgi:hypothetical protein
LLSSPQRTSGCDLAVIDPAEISRASYLRYESPQGRYFEVRIHQDLFDLVLTRISGGRYVRGVLIRTVAVGPKACGDLLTQLHKRRLTRGYALTQFEQELA